MRNIYILIVLLIQAFAFGQTTSNILDNGNFHDCNQDWEISGDFTYACGDDFYTHYNFSYGYGYNLQIDDAYGTLKQDVSFPENITEVELELYHKISTEEINNNVAYDKLFIRLVSESETYEVAVLSNEDYSNNYIHKTYNIPSSLFENETVTLKFIVDNDGLKPTRFRVDDVSLNVTTNDSSSNFPDLEVLNPVLESDTVEVGDVINISCDVTEVNNEDCDSSKLRYYFSDNNTFSADDQSLGSDNVSSLDGLESDNEDKNITVPNVSNGVYYILFVADADEEIDESNENNNVTAVTITVSTSNSELPDLQALNPTLESNNVEVDEIINISCDVTLVSGSDCESSKLRYYISNDTSLSADDIAVGSDNVSSLNNGESDNEDKNITIPDVASGTYYVLFVVDADEEIEESNESNNTIAVTINITNDSNTSGTLKVIINPTEAVNNGAQWRVDSGAWLNHNQTISIDAGTYTVEYKTISGYNGPNPETVTVSENEDKVVYGNYTVFNNTLYGALNIQLTPYQATLNGAQWRIDGGTWKESNETVTLTVGNYSISYKTISGYTAPDSETVSVYENETTSITRTYEENLPTPSISIKYPRGAGTYNGVEQYFDDAYVAGVKIRLLAGLEYVPTNSDIELWYSLNNGASWNYSESFQVGYISGSSVLDVEWYCNSNIDSETVKIKLILNSNGQNIEATNAGVFEIHPPNKYTSFGFNDDGLSILEDPFLIDDDLSLILGDANNQGGHICSDFYSMDYSIVDTSILNLPYNVTCNKPFYSPLDGVVIKINNDLEPNCTGNSGSNSGSGNQVIVQSSVDKTKAFRILHLNYVNVSVGDYINIGDYLGDLGSTGANTTGPHAHTSLYKNINVSSNLDANTNELVRFIDYLNNDDIIISFNTNSCNLLKNYHSAPFDFHQNESTSNVVNSRVFSDLENSEYTIFIPEDNIQPNIRIFNLNGTEVRTMDNVIMNAVANGSTRNININEFPSGIYIISVQSDAKQYTHKIVKN